MYLPEEDVLVAKIAQHVKIVNTANIVVGVRSVASVNRS
jgi:hypothetical protein